MKSLKRAKYIIRFVAFGLLVSAVTIWPMANELKLMVRIIGGDSAATGHLHGFLLRVIEGIGEVNAAYPFLFLGGEYREKRLLRHKVHLPQEGFEAGGNTTRKIAEEYLQSALQMIDNAESK